MTTSSSNRPETPTAQGAHATVRYQVTALDASIAFYTGQLGFTLEQRTGPFASVLRGSLRLILSGPGTSGARPTPDGRRQEPGGWNRIVLYVESLESEVARLKQQGARFRGQVESGPGGSQIMVEDPDGNPIELHEAPKQSAQR